jgi:hypothetical protein
MKKASMAVRILMGLMFFIFGLNGFLHFLPMPPMEGEAAEFIGLLMTSKLFFVIKTMEVACAILLLWNQYTTIAYLLLAPIIFNIFWFHVTLAPQGAPMGILLLAMEGFLLWSNKKAYLPLLKAK